MYNRKYDSGYEKLQQKRRIEKLIKSQRGALDRFFTSNKKDEKTSENFDVEQPILNELEDDEVMIEKDNIENISDEACHATSFDKKHKENVEEPKINEDHNQNLYNVSPNMFDLGRWENIDTKLRDLCKKRSNSREQYKFSKR